MQEKYLTFRRFNDPEDASDLLATLDSNNIPYLIEDASPSFDVTFAGNTFDKEVHIKLRPSDFESTEELLLNNTKVSTDELPKDYYLLEFTNEELIEILMKPDEWSPTDYKLSQQILKERGKEVDAEFISTLKKKRYEELSKPEESQKNWIYAGYIFALIGGLFGLFIGWHLTTFKKTLPNGQRVYGYVESDRKNGRIILILGLIFSAIWLMVGLKDYYR